MRAIGRVVSSVFAAVAILGIVAGVPAVLWMVARVAFAVDWPAPEDLLALLVRPDDGRLLVGFLLLVGAAAWAQLTLSLIAEFVGVVRHRPTVRVELPGLRLSRTIAALLVGALLSVGSATASAAPAPLSAAASLRTSPDGASATASSEGPEYEVQPRDTLWRIAEKALGDPLRWREIYTLNAGREQPDGEELSEASLLRTGWRLQLPADAALDGEMVVVRPGDTLSGIAADRLDYPGRAEELFDENRGRLQPDGRTLSRPDLILPGWTLELPESTQSDAAAPTTPDPERRQPARERQPAPTHEQPAPPDRTSRRPAPAPSPRTPPDERAPEVATTQPALPMRPEQDASRPDRGASLPTHDAGEQVGAPEADSDHDVAMPTIVLGASSLVVAGAVAALAVRRRRQLRARRPYHRIAVPSDEAGYAEWLAAAAEPLVDIAFLDAILRGLALNDWTELDPPRLRTAMLEAERAVVSLSFDVALPEPFEPLGHGSWSAPGTAALPVAPDESRGYCAPFPALVSVATGFEEQTLFVDLEELGVAHVTGGLGLATGLLRHVAAELANSPWSEDCEVLLVGFGAELIPLNPERLRVLPDIAAGLAEVRARLRSARDTIAQVEVPSLLHGRLGGIAPDAWLPVVLLATGPATDQERSELADLASEIGGEERAPVAVVTAGVALAGHEVHVTDGSQLLMADIGDGPWSAEIMSGSTGTGLAEILAPTTQPDEPAEPAEGAEPWAEGMQEDGTLSDPPKQAATSPADPEAVRRLAIVDQQDPYLDQDLDRWATQGSPDVPLIGILGEPVVRAPGQFPSVRPSWFTEVLVYLSLHPLGVTMQKAMTDLWPEGHKIDPATVRHAFYGARRWAGRGLDGDPERAYVSDMQSDSTYRLRGHLLDWDLFRRLRKRAQARHAAAHEGAAADYEQALGLIRGPVLSALRPGGYAWLNNHDQRHDLQIPGFLVDAAHELVEIALTAGDLELARRTAETARGVDVDVVFDRPLTDLMRIAHAEDRQGEMERYAAILLDARGFDVPEELPPETFAVLNELLPHGPRRRS
ncbi:LysM peptidoglycan-binding domain-containing protein [Pseudonocardia sp. DLS-67]